MVRTTGVALALGLLVSGCGVTALRPGTGAVAALGAERAPARSSALQVREVPEAPPLVRKAVEAAEHRYLDHLMRDEQLQFPSLVSDRRTLQVRLGDTVLAYIVSRSGMAQEPDDEPERRSVGKVGFGVDFWQAPTGEPLMVQSGFQVTVRGPGRLPWQPVRPSRGDAGSTFSVVAKPPVVAAALDALYDRQLRAVQERFYPLRFTPYDVADTCLAWRHNGAVIGYFDSGVAGTKGGQGRLFGVQAWNLIAADGRAVHGFGRTAEPLGTPPFQLFPFPAR
jgi:hypothetical protein